MIKNIVDVTVGTQNGDEGKGKVTHHLCRSGGYSHVLRWGGGCNAGHSIYHNGRKFVTHLIPSGVFFGIKSIIGNGCVLNVEKFLSEVDELESAGVCVRGNLYIAENVHITTDWHLKEEVDEGKIGTTRMGIGPTYRDKYARKGVLAKQIPELADYMIDLYDEFHCSDYPLKILCEGAQGFGLDVNWGDYPYVTSSSCELAGVFQNAIDPRWLNDVWGVAKIYETYVGAKRFEPADPIFTELRGLGEEFGATTGRPRQCDWLDLDFLAQSLKMNSCTHLVLSKMDVVRSLGVWRLYHQGLVVDFENEGQMKDFIVETLPQDLIIYFSEHKDRI